MNRWIPVLGWVLLISSAPRAAACQHPDNLVVNCGFDSGLTPWTTGGNAYYSPSNGSSAPGSAALPVFDGTNIVASVSQCVTGVSGNVGYGFGVDALLYNDPGGTWQCWMAVTQNSDAACNAPTISSYLVLSPAGSWTQSQSSHTTLPQTQSVRLELICTSDSWPFVVLVDDAFYGPGLVPVELSGFKIE